MGEREREKIWTRELGRDGGERETEKRWTGREREKRWTNEERERETETYVLDEKMAE